MSSITVDQETQAKLANFKHDVEIRDEAGRLLGLFTPAEELFTYNGISAPITKEEVDRRSKEGGGRSLREILSDLERQK